MPVWVRLAVRRNVLKAAGRCCLAGDGDVSGSAGGVRSFRKFGMGSVAERNPVLPGRQQAVCGFCRKRPDFYRERPK